MAYEYEPSKKPINVYKGLMGKIKERYEVWNARERMRTKELAERKERERVEYSKAYGSARVQNLRKKARMQARMDMGFGAGKPKGRSSPGIRFPHMFDIDFTANQPDLIGQINPRPRKIRR